MTIPSTQSVIGVDNYGIGEDHRGMTNTRHTRTLLTVTDVRGTVRTYPITSRTLVDAYILAIREAMAAMAE